MEVKLLEGGIAKLKLRGKRFGTNQTSVYSKSKFQYSIGQKLLAKYPYDIIFTEIIVPIDNFILDFFIPSLKMVIECHGKQHTEHIRHFHKTVKDYHKQQDTDQKKRDWCKLNGFKLIEIYDE